MQSPNSWETVMIGNGTGSTVPRRAYLAAVVNEQSRRLVIGATVFDYAAAWARLGCTSYYSCFRCASFWRKYLNFLEIGGLVITCHMTSRVPWSQCLWLVILYSNARLMKVRKTLPKLHLLHPKRAKKSPLKHKRLEDYMVSFSEALCIPFWHFLTGVNYHVS